MRHAILSLALGMCATLTPAAANASLGIHIFEVGPNVVAITSGSLAFNLFDAGSMTLTPGIQADDAFIALGDPGATVDGYNGFTGTGEFGVGPGSGTFVAPSVSSGTPFAIAGYVSGTPSPVVWVPQGYSGGSIDATAIWYDQTFASLGLTPGPGDYEFTIVPHYEYVEVNIDDVFTCEELDNVYCANVAGVPEPSAWAMMLLGFAGIGLAMAHRRASRSPRPAAN